MSQAYDGLRINALCQEILNNLTSTETKDMFLEKLANAGFRFESDYDEFVFDMRDFDTYLVSDSFPKLQREKIPEAIAKVQYDLLLATIAKYKEN